MHAHVDICGCWENVAGPDGIIVYVGHVLTGTDSNVITNKHVVFLLSGEIGYLL